MGLLHSEPDWVAACFVSSCPNLEVLDVSTALEGEPGTGVIYTGGDDVMYHPVVFLEDCTKLTSLRLTLEHEEWCQAAWRCVGNIKTLRKLEVLHVLWQQLGGAMELTRLEGFMYLDVGQEDSPSCWLRLQNKVSDTAAHAAYCPCAWHDQAPHVALYAVCRVGQVSFESASAQLRWDVGGLQHRSALGSLSASARPQCASWLTCHVMWPACAAATGP